VTGSTRPRGFSALVLLAMSLVSLRLDAAQPTLAEVLRLAGEYVTNFERELSGMVAEEHYVQDVGVGGATVGVRGGPLTLLSEPKNIHREFKSDLLLVHTDSRDGYVQYRDVFEVDGQPVRDRSERLLDLFTSGTPSPQTTAARLMAESSRFNIGNVDRNINVPVFALRFLEPQNQSRFRFSGKMMTAASAPKGEGRADFSASAEVWVVEYKETERRTFIHTSRNRDLPSHGRFWIEPSTGRVLMTELVAEDTLVHGIVTVTYQAPSNTGLLVPTEMREAYWESGLDQRFEASALYTNFRRFSVTTKESIATPKE
jgi:hypothetical protein